MRPPAKESLGRPITRLHDAQLELVAKGLRLEARMRFIGRFTTHTAAIMNPPPEAGDVWIEYDPDAVGDELREYAVLQISTASGARQRCYWPVTTQAG